MGERHYYQAHFRQHVYYGLSGVLILGNGQALHLVPCVLLHLTSSIPQALLLQKFLHRFTLGRRLLVWNSERCWSSKTTKSKNLHDREE
jgi:hypothetical protein